MIGYWILHIFIYAVIMYLDKKTDLDLIADKLAVNHVRGGIIRLVALIANVSWLIAFHFIGWEFAGKLLLLECAIWWILFDIWLNTGNNQTPFHVGGSWIDKQFLKLNYGDYWIIAIKFSVLTSVLWNL